MKKRTFFGTCGIVFGILSALCGMVSADTVFMKNGDKIENVTLAEITRTEVKYKVGKRTVLYTILKSDVSKIVYSDGAEDVFEVKTQTQTQNQTRNQIEDAPSFIGGEDVPAVSRSGGLRIDPSYTYNHVTRVDHLGFLNNRVSYAILNNELNTLDIYTTVHGFNVTYDTAGVSSFLTDYAERAKQRNNYMVSAGYSSLGFNAFAAYAVMRRERRFADETLVADRFAFVDFGIGLAEKGIIGLSLNVKTQLFSFNTSEESNILSGIDVRSSLQRYETAVSLDFLYKQWLLSIGFGYYLDYDYAEYIGSSLTLNAGYFIKELAKKSDLPINDYVKHVRQKSTQKRYFRPGIEINYPVYRSEIEFFNNKFPYAAGSAGLFFRIGPDNVYFTTGAYAKLDYLYRDSVVSAQLSGPFGITIARLPLLDVSWSKFSVEVPALLSFGAGQIRFSGGMLFDFYAVSEFSVNVNEKVPIIGGQNVISANDAETLEKRFGEAPTGSMYVALGLDFDIVKYWGIGVKCLIFTNTFGEERSIESYKGFKPADFQTRVSTYFVF